MGIFDFTGDIYFSPDGKRGDEMSFVNSSQRFSGLSSVPPWRSM
jgi:hypothetical protein